MKVTYNIKDKYLKHLFLTKKKKKKVLKILRDLYLIEHNSR